MMKAIKVDKNRDIVVIAGKIQFVYDIDVIKQNCIHAVLQLKKELNYEQSKGIDYFDNVFTSNVNLQRFEAQIRDNLKNVNGVLSIESLTKNIQGSVLAYSVKIKTTFGDMNINDTIKIYN